MKKALSLLFCVVFLCGCNKNIGTRNYSYYFLTCDGPIKIQNEMIASWKEFDTGQIEVTLSNGNTLLINSYYCVLSENKIDKEIIQENKGN